jgi:hypothetical protein
LVYDGAWQTSDDDFDPSIPTEFQKDKESLRADCWWFKYPDPLVGKSGQSHEDWIFEGHIADFLPLLSILQPTNNRRWLTLAGYRFWDEQAPYNADKWNHLRRSAWVHFRSWLVKTSERDQFIQSLKGKHFYGNGIELDKSHDGWLGDYPYGKSHSLVIESCAARKRRWLQGDTTPVISTACHITEKSLLVPSAQTLGLLSASWSGKGLEYVSPAGEVVAFNPSVLEPGPEFVLADFENYQKAISAESLSIVWTVLGERHVLGGMSTSSFQGALEFSGIYWIERGKVVGGITQRKRLEPRKEN